MRVEASWKDTARGPALFVSLGGLNASVLECDLGEKAVHSLAISLFEGIAGVRPAGFFSRWHWRRDYKRVLRGVRRAVAERGAYSAA